MAKRPPWKKPTLHKKAGRRSKKLSTGRKAAAKRAAKKGGRRYPNLVDNMRVAAKKKRRKAGKR